MALNRRRKNSIDHFTYDQKKEYYFVKNVVGDFAPFSNDIRNVHSWTPMEIEKRHHHMLENLKILWELH